MPGRRTTIIVSLLSVALLILAVTPASARFARAAGEAINPAEACPRYLSLEVASQDVVAEPVTIQAYAVSDDGTRTLVLERTLNVREVEPPLQPLLLPPPGEDVEKDEFNFHRRAVLRWDKGRLAPGTTIEVRTAESGEMGATTTVSKRCDTPRLRLDLVDKSAESFRWRVRNPTDEESTFNAEVLLSHPAEVRVGVVPARGEVEFTTNRRAGPTIVLLFVGGKLVDVELARRR